MNFELKILGANSATPAYGRFPTCQLLQAGNQQFLIDCGEGAQMQMQAHKVGVGKLNHIFISHLHGDHFFGLIGLLNSLSLMGREEHLHIYGPHGLDEIITTQLKYGQNGLRFKATFTPLRFEEAVVYEDNYLTVETIPLDHSIPCTGFLFREKPGERRMIKDKIPDDMSVHSIKTLKGGEDVLASDGRAIYRVEEYTLPPRHARSYAFCSDTRFNEAMVNQIRFVDLLYHEATFMADMADEAHKRHHSTTVQAAEIARKAGAGQLVIGHYSSRYKQLEPLLTEAQSVFSPTLLAVEGASYSLSN